MFSVGYLSINYLSLYRQNDKGWLHGTNHGMFV